MTPQEFQTLAVAELDSVYRLACHLARNSAEAEDLVQETYLRAFRSAETFSLSDRGIRPWLFKILHNVLLTRGQQRHREQSALAELRPRETTHPVNPPVDCAAMDWENVDARVKSAIGSLTVEYRLVFMLWALESLKYREIAEIIDAPIGTVMSRLSRARQLLGEKLKDFGSEHGFDRPTRNAAEPSGDV